MSSAQRQFAMIAKAMRVNLKSLNESRHPGFVLRESGSQNLRIPGLAHVLRWWALP